MGNAFAYSTSRITAILAPNVFLLGELWKLGPWVLLLSVLVLDCLLNLFFLPETKNRPLPDLEEEDDEDAVEETENVVDMM